ncbi:MAG TPA: hypothetical protein DDY91_19850, partial [Planctomycetaceae bacterium]|nr:hypothetical protein [Planctomycetaceae bacterium]
MECLLAGSQNDELGRPGAPVDHRNSMVSAPGASEQDSPGNPGTPPQAQPADLDAYSQEKGRPSLPRSGEIGSLPRRQRTVFLVPFTGPL